MSSANANTEPSKLGTYSFKEQSMPKPNAAAQMLKKMGNRMHRPHSSRNPLWKGPEVDGITFSMLSRFLVCRERFRVMAIEGWRTQDAFNARTSYGDMWHVCEEALAAEEDWQMHLKAHARNLCIDYPMQKVEIEKWYNVCKVQFPLYVDYWRKHPDVKRRKPVLEEKVLDHYYQLPSGRVIRLRGKIDSVDLVLDPTNVGIWQQENKTKGRVVEQQLVRQLKFDLQTMIYLVCLHDLKEQLLAQLRPSGEKIAVWAERLAKYPIVGVRYNVIQRPLSGGKGSIVRYKPSKRNPKGESAADFYERLRGKIEDSPGDFFKRWNVRISPKDVEKFRRTCLDPILENLCDWYAQVTNGPWSISKECLDNNDGCPPDDYQTPMNWRHPFGVFNPLDEGGCTDLDDFLDTGSTVGLKQVERLFKELTP